MPRINEARVLSALEAVIDPKTGRDVVSSRMISGLAIKNDDVIFALEVDPALADDYEAVRVAAERAVEDIPGVGKVTAVLTAQRDVSPEDREVADNLKGPSRGTRPNGNLAPSIRAVIAVASGKGGVGKSTTAVNLALALSGLGLSVGLLDADIYGPSIPRMMGMVGQPISLDGKTMEPMEGYDLKVVSIGFLVEPDAPVVWRGPMVMGAVQQLLRDVNWGPLDVLVVDMPPGTGDAQLTLAQSVPLAGAVIVSTPQDIALLDARKGFAMFRKMDVPVLGVIENMSYFVCPECGHVSHVFNHGGARKAAEDLGADFLGEIPLDIVIRETSDEGRPIVVGEPNGPLAQAYVAVAQKIREKLDLS